MNARIVQLLRYVLRTMLDGRIGGGAMRWPTIGLLFMVLCVSWCFAVCSDVECLLVVEIMRGGRVLCETMFARIWNV